MTLTLPLMWKVCEKRREEQYPKPTLTNVRAVAKTATQARQANGLEPKNRLKQSSPNHQNRRMKYFLVRHRNRPAFSLPPDSSSAVHRNSIQYPPAPDGLLDNGQSRPGE